MTTPEPLLANNVALLVMDVQPVTLRVPADPDAFVANVATAIATLRTVGGHIGYVRVAFTPADRDAVPPTNKAFAAIATGTTLDADAPQTAIDPRIAPVDGDVVVRKVRVGAFSTTELDAQLKARHVTTLILAGISTSGVVLSTVRDAADRDYRLFVLADATADANDEVHRVLTEKVFPRQADVITVADLPGLFVAVP